MLPIRTYDRSGEQLWARKHVTKEAPQLSPRLQSFGKPMEFRPSLAPHDAARTSNAMPRRIRRPGTHFFPEGWRWRRKQMTFPPLRWLSSAVRRQNCQYSIAVQRIDGSEYIGRNEIGLGPTKGKGQLMYRLTDPRVCEGFVLDASERCEQKLRCK